MTNDHKCYRIKGRSGKRTHKRQNDIDRSVIFTVIIYGNLKTMFTCLAFFLFCNFRRRLILLFGSERTIFIDCLKYRRENRGGFVRIRIRNYYNLFESK